MCILPVSPHGEQDRQNSSAQASMKDRMSGAAKSIVTLKEDPVYYILTVCNLRFFYHLCRERRGLQFYS
jgi:hypothetical protein